MKKKLLSFVVLGTGVIIAQTAFIVFYPGSSENLWRILGFGNLFVLIACFMASFKNKLQILPLLGLIIGISSPVLNFIWAGRDIVGQAIPYSLSYFCFSMHYILQREKPLTYFGWPLLLCSFLLWSFHVFLANAGSGLPPFDIIAFFFSLLMLLVASSVLLIIIFEKNTIQEDIS
ncbi:MAG: hypothetical protein GX421_04955 [Caldisericales bacterium]|nr:hypothetical protein [Caldisericales bacterium]